MARGGERRGRWGDEVRSVVQLASCGRTRPGVPRSARPPCDWTVAARAAHHDEAARRSGAVGPPRRPLRRQPRAARASRESSVFPRPAAELLAARCCCARFPMHTLC